MTNSKTTRKALLSSALALTMCVAMLIATTFAWFTDTASTSVNKIQAGTLDVELYYGNNTTGEEGTTWTKIDSTTGALQFVKAEAGEKQEILWEPGCTYSLPALKIKNEGNLALKYKVLFSAVDTDEANLELARVLDVTMNGKTAGTLYDVLTSEDADGYAHGNLAGNAETDPITLSVKMSETAGNEYQKLAIGGIAITVVATQDTVEYDSKENTYDNDAAYPTVEVTQIADAQKAIAEGSKVLLLNKNLDVKENDLGEQRQASDGKNYAALFFNKEQDAAMADTITLNGNATISTWRKAIWASHGANIVINGGTYTSVVEGKDKYLGSDLIYANNDAVITINGGTFSSNAQGELFNVSNQKGDGEGGTIIIQGGLYNKPLIANSGSTVNAWQAEDAYGDHEGKTYGIKIADGYKVVEETIDNATWYRVVKE